MIIRELISRIGFTVDPRGLTIYEHALQRIDDKLKQTYEGTNKVLDRMGGIGKALSMKLSLPIAALATVSVMARVKQEEQQKTWGVLLDSLDAGKKKVAELRELSTKVQFDPEQILQYAESLKRLRVPVDEIIPRLKMYSDIAAGTGQPVEDLIELQGMMNLGEARGRYLINLIRKGVIEKGNVQKLTGYSNLKGIMRASSSGQVTAQQVMNIIDALGKQNAGKAAELSDTLGKSWINFWEALTKTREAIGEVIQKLFHLNGILKAGEKLFRWFAKMIETMPMWLKIIVAVLGGLLALIGPLIVGLVAVGHAIVGVMMAVAGLKLAGLLGQGQTIMMLLPRIATAFWGIATAAAAVTAEIMAGIAAALALIFLFRQLNIVSRQAGKQDAFAKHVREQNAYSVYKSTQIPAQLLAPTKVPDMTNLWKPSITAGKGMAVNSNMVVNVTVPHGTTAEQQAVIQSGATSAYEAIKSKLNAELVLSIHKSIRG